MLTRLEIARIAKFGLVGVIATLMFAAFAGYLMQWVPLPAANGTAFIISTTFAYLANAKLTFRRGHCRASAKRYGLGATAGLITAVTVSALAQAAGLLGWLNILSVILVVAPINYSIHRFWTFANRHYEASPPEIPKVF